MSPRDETAGGLGAYVRFLALALGILAVLVALGWAPTRRLGGDEALDAMLAACAIALCGSLIGTVPIVLSRGLPPPQRTSAVLGSMALRLTLVLFAGGAAALTGRLVIAPLIIWLVIAHTGLLVADTRFALKALGTEKASTEER